MTECTQVVSYHSRRPSIQEDGKNAPCNYLGNTDCSMFCVTLTKCQVSDVKKGNECNGEIANISVHQILHPILYLMHKEESSMFVVM
jgi:hypothetical protein